MWWWSALCIRRCDRVECRRETEQPAVAARQRRVLDTGELRSSGHFLFQRKPPRETGATPDSWSCWCLEIPWQISQEWFLLDLYTFKTIKIYKIDPNTLKKYWLFLATYSLEFCTISTQIDRYHTCLVDISVEERWRFRELPFWCSATMRWRGSGHNQVSTRRHGSLGILTNILRGNCLGIVYCHI